MVAGGGGVGGGCTGIVLFVVAIVFPGASLVRLVPRYHSVRLSVNMRYRYSC